MTTSTVTEDQPITKFSVRPSSLTSHDSLQSRVKYTCTVAGDLLQTISGDQNCELLKLREVLVVNISTDCLNPSKICIDSQLKYNERSPARPKSWEKNPRTKNTTFHNKSSSKCGEKTSSDLVKFDSKLQLNRQRKRNCTRRKKERKTLFKWFKKSFSQAFRNNR
ncbi:MAG: hypothetical protein MHMPM18_001905 [Marteilia pararefringens]